MTTKLKLTGTPDTLRHSNLADPVWHVQHIAKAFGITVDRARRHTRRDSFPAPKDGFERNCYCREAVLTWIRGLPDAPPSRSPSRGKYADHPHRQSSEQTDTHHARAPITHPTDPEPQRHPLNENNHPAAPTPPTAPLYKPRRKR